MEASSVATGGGRSKLGRSPLSGLPDKLLRWGLTALAALILVIIAYFFVRLYNEAQPAFSKFGVLHFTFANDWDVSKGIYGAWPLLVGTLITSALALKQPLTIMVELLAAVPSVVYGLWAVYVLIPKLLPAEKWVASTFHGVPFIGGGAVAGPNYFIGGLVLAIMIIPIVSAISREVMSTVPVEHKEAALALGATRWEMIRIAVLPYSRAGISGAAMLGLGRAIGETIAVTLVIGNAPQLSAHLFGQGYTLAAVIANEFGEAAADPVHRAALIAAGLVLFVLTLFVNALARWFVLRGEKKRGGSVAEGMAAGG
jgi:ABC-type phosphate transport system permease subunit